MSQSDDGKFETLLEYLRRTRGFNFGGYKRDSLRRRIGRRMQTIGVPDYDDYLDHLEAHPQEFAHLFDTILINVTDFFRDPLAWQMISGEIIPRVLTGKPSGGPVRCWSAGCASGAEAYTLAMVLAEALGPEAFRDRVKIYATDLDDGALNKARHACYEPREVQGVPPPLLEKYFERLGHRYVFHRELRRAVIFGRHDLMQDAPISRIDLLICRNTLMYFTSEAQARILDRFHFALNDRGFLFLGKAETLLSYSHIFTAVDIKRRLFAKVPKGTHRPRPLTLMRPGDPANDGRSGEARLRESAFDQSPFPQMVVDAEGRLSLANEPARRLFGLAATDLGRPLQDLKISYSPADLRSCIDRVYAERRAVTLDGVEWAVGGPDARRHYDVHVVPVLDTGGGLIGVTIAFLDVSEARVAKESHERSSHELEQAHEELQSANEELETTNEELQSANEELETTNEELQSANEELETTNEELQSTNEELEAVNEELRQRSDELNETNFFHQAILSSLNNGVVVIDPELIVRAWNERAEDFWGLRAGEVRGRDLFGLDIGLPLGALRPSVQTCLEGRSDREWLTLDATNRRGRAIRCAVTCTPMADGVAIRGVVLEMQELDGNGLETSSKQAGVAEPDGSQ